MSRVRNFIGVKHQGLREKVDVLTNELHDELEDAYYGTYISEGVRSEDGWKHGVSKPWEGFDVRVNATQSLKQFQILHGMLFHIHNILFHKVNLLEPEVIPASDYDENTDKDAVLHIKSSESRQWIIDTAQQYGVNPKKIRNRLILRVKETLNHDIILD